jgi:hypothetical protein
MHEYGSIKQPKEVKYALKINVLDPRIFAVILAIGCTETFDKNIIPIIETVESLTKIRVSKV